MILAKFMTIFSILAVLTPGSPDLRHWVDISDGIDSGVYLNLHTVNSSGLLLTTDTAVYFKPSAPEPWKRLFTIQESETLVDAVRGTGDDGKIFIATTRRVYKGNLKGSSFEEVFSRPAEDRITALEVLPPADQVFIGTNKGLWRLNPSRRYLASVIPDIQAVTVLKAHPYKPAEVFAGTERGLFKISKGGRDVKLIYTSAIRSSAKVNSVAVSRLYDEVVFIATEAGLIRMKLRDKEFRDMTLGEGILYVNAFAVKPEIVVALSSGAVFYSSGEWDKWASVTAGLPGGMLRRIERTGDGRLFLLTENGVYMSAQDGMGLNRKNGIEELFSGEPSIEEVERKAIRAYMIETGLIKRWRSRSRSRAWLPKISLDIGSDIDRDYDLTTNDTIYASSSSGRYFIGPDDNSLSESRGMKLSYGVKLSWDLGELLFSSDEITVSNEAEDIMDFKFRIINEVRRVYFERRRAIVEYNMDTASDELKRFELKNRIDELTAYLDSMTDGYFTQAISLKIKK